MSAADFDSALSAAAEQLGSQSAASVGPSYPSDASLEERSHDLFSARLLEKARSVVVCDSCGDLWLQREPGSKEYERFSPAD